jgi:uncharacterized oligopeptide transporter (OPT) family protein
LSDKHPTALDDVAPPPARTPPSIVFALLLFAFAIATPFMGLIDARDAKGGGWASFGVVVGWLFAGAAAAFTGIICTFVGARLTPRSGWTALAIVLACLAALMFLKLLLAMAI